MGSPPRMRGKRADVPVQTGAKRITPADAGKTCCSSSSQTPLQDHPRGCGENVDMSALSSGVSGSPPRMRGKLGDNPTMPPIPEDHPRGCGENVLDGTEKDETLGSPPRMRGKRGYVPVGGHDGGITPADAGKTALMPDGGAVKWDHPRGCGENCRCAMGTRIIGGSPPRMRGKRSVRHENRP